MRTLLRSCLVAKIADPPELLLQNIVALDASGLLPEVPEEKTLWRLIRDFAKLHQHAPDVKTIQLQLSASSDLTTLDYLTLVLGEPVKTRGDFHVYLERQIEERRVSKILDDLAAARAIATTGIEIEGERGRKRKLRGADATLEYLRAEMRQVERAPNGIKVFGGITGTEATAAARAEYERAKISPVIGNLTGLMQLDTVIRGSKPKELWTHAASTGHLKSTFAANWAYNLAIYYKRSSLYFSLEMNYAQVRRQIHAMHSLHHKFRGIRISLGLQVNEAADVGLDYERIRDGGLSPAQEEFYLGHVLPDLEDEANAYGRIHIRVPDPDPRRPPYTVAKIVDVAERTYADDPFTKIIVDHAGLVGADGHFNSETERRTAVFKGLKALADGFHGGQGIAVLALCQINREGYKGSIRKKEAGRLPRYSTTDLAWAAEAENASDVITTSYLDEGLRARQRALFDCLKSRDGAPPAPFLVQQVPASRRIFCCDEKPVVEVAATQTRRAAKVQELSSTLDALNVPFTAPKALRN